MSGDALSFQTVYDAWPADVRALFNSDVDAAMHGSTRGFTASLACTDDAGRICTALLSAGELLAPDVHTLCFALWPSSRTARAIETAKRATLGFVANDAFHQVQLDVHRAMLEDAPLACFVAMIASGEAQRVGYARLTSGITFELAGDASVQLRWRAQIEWLKRAYVTVSSSSMP